MIARRVTAIGGDVSTDGLGLNDADRALFATLRHRHPLGRRRQLRQPARPGASRSTCSARSRIADTLNALERHARTSSRSAPATSPATAAATHPRSSSARARATSASTGARRSPPPAACAATPRPPAATPSSSPSSASEARKELGAAGAPALAAKTEQLRERWVKDAAGRGRPRPRRQRRLARRLRVTPRRSASRPLTEVKGNVPVSIVRPSHHRVRTRRAVPRLDPRLPHGRAGHPQLRPRPAEGVPRRARGHRRRHPGRHRRRRHHRRRRARPRAGRAHHPGGQRRHQPAEVPACSSTTCAPGSPSTRCTTTRASRSWCPSGSSPAAAGCRSS